MSLYINAFVFVHLYIAFFNHAFVMFMTVLSYVMLCYTRIRDVGTRTRNW